MRRISTTVNLLCAQADEKWGELRVNAENIRSPGLAGDPQFDTTNYGWLFDHLASEMLFVGAALPYQWKELSDITLAVHWEKTTNAPGNVDWHLEYKWSPVGGARDANWTTLTASTAMSETPDNGSADVHLINSFGAISTTGREIGDALVMKFYRYATLPTDTYSADARALAVGVYFTIDARGAEQKLTK